MAGESVNTNHRRGALDRVTPVVGPALLIAIGYVDPGKWAATVEGGARFGFDLLVPLLLSSFAAILCQYLSARIGVVTGKDLAQICSAEYDSWTCMFLGLQTAMSVIALDLTMIIGIAHALNLLFGAELSTCVFLAAVDAVLYPLFATLLGRCNGKLFCTCIAGIMLLFYFLGVFTSQPEIPFSMNSMVAKFNEESLFALMSLLGANVMPHNFYIHSSLVLEHQEPPIVSKDALCLHHLFAIVCIFSGIYLVNYVLMNSAAIVFHGTGLVLLTFTDAMSLMEQVFRSPLAPLAFLLILYLTSQVTALTWNLGGQVVLNNFLRLDIPNWLQHATIRVMAIVPALYCVWTCGAEGIYQLLIFTQVMVALLLPSSVIPLFRVSSSRQIMGAQKASQLLEFLALITLLGMLVLKIIFVVELAFGTSDWVGNLSWNLSNSSLPYALLLITACLSLCLMLWLAATPLKSATMLDAQVWSLDAQGGNPLSSSLRKEDLLGDRYNGEESIRRLEESQQQAEKPIQICSDITVATDELDLPETIMESDQEMRLTTIEENQPITLNCSPQSDSKSVSAAVNMVADSNNLDAKPDKAESELVEKTVGTEGDLHTGKDDEERDSWGTEESSKGVPGSTSSLTSDGPGSYRSLSGKGDEGGNGAASLSRLAGLGRAARRQLAAVLDEFWGQLFDFHGQVTQEAKTRKLDALCIDSKPAFSLKVDTHGKDFSGFLSPVGGRGSDSLLNSSLCNSSEQLRIQNNFDSSYGVQRGSSSLWSNHMQLLDAYVQGSGRNLMDPMERRYSSVRTLPSSDVQGSSRNAVEANERRYSSVRSLPTSDARDYQPATVHGYQMGSIVNRTAKDRSSSCLNGQMESPGPMSPSLGSRSYRDPLSVALGQKQPNGLSSPQPMGFQNVAVSRNSALLSERQYQDVRSPGSCESAGMATSTKKYHSLPDISGLAGPYKELYMAEKSTQWDSSVIYGSSTNRTSYDSSPYSTTGSGPGGSMVFNGLSRGYGEAFDGLPKGYGDAFSSLSLSKGYGDAFFNTTPGRGSLWSKQPFEQFGVADKVRADEGAAVTKSISVTREATPVVDSESQLLQSFRRCILKLLKLEGSDWLFGQSDGADEELIDRVAAREIYIYEAETREISHVVQMGEPHYLYSVPHCGEGCVWRADLVVSFGVWCIHRVLDLSLMESRPELWGKYTYVLNRLQGVIDLAFSRPRSPISPCFCLQIPATHQQRSSPPSNGMLPPAAKPARGKCTTAAMLLDLIKDVEMAISSRKGRSGTAAGDVAFPKGKENLASVLKRYKRRLSNKTMGGGK
ncbi:hypothetical protein Tsubulata_021548 [Turnera subulata]|uniref:Ethylene-insensitive protein 2 n=1 Tax=Turnera subulata TaxID=218843 RepID=A0A9Q0G5W4_9ROSI|nr:hypothetical protein Tsubulata_021548 [Turnera subulata]